MNKPYYHHAGITIYQGDCREILPELACFDLLLTDPPYGIGESSRKNNSRGKAFGSKSHAPHNTRNRIIPPTDYGHFEWDSKPADQEVLNAAIHQCAQAIVWGGNYFALPPRRGWLVWDKQNSGDFADCELAWTNLETAVRICRHMWNGMLRATENNGARFHPTQKPIALMGWCLSFSKTAKSLLDPWCGSGSSLIAGKAAGMHSVGIDIEERYCEIAAKRLSQEVLDLQEVL